MSREIKFRAWDSSREVMMQPFVAYTKEDGLIKVTEDWHEEEGPHEWDKGYRANELMQYTGLKDKNGKEIYEGDVILIEGKKHEIKCEGCYFDAFPLLAFANTLERFHDECEIIGNIYENPDLLK